MDRISKRPRGLAGAFEEGDGCAGIAAEFVGDEEPDAAGHQDVVVVAVLCAERAVGLSFVGGQFVDGFRVPFAIGGVADGGDVMVHNQRFCGAVGVEAHTGGAVARSRVERVAIVDVRVDIGYFVEDEAGVFALGHFRFQRVAFNHQQGAVVPQCDLCRLPCQQVVVGVSAPLCRNRWRFVTLFSQIEYGNHRKVA